MEEIIKRTKNLGVLIIKPVSKKLAKEMDKVVWRRNHTLLTDRMVKLIYELV